jgi:methionine synthase II (cobalamin-independent)
MKRSDRRIITTHVGSQPRPDDLMALYKENASDESLQPQLRSAVSDIVRRNWRTLQTLAEGARLATKQLWSS